MPFLKRRLTKKIALLTIGINTNLIKNSEMISHLNSLLFSYICY